LQKKDLSLTKMIEHVLTLCRERARQAGIELVQDISGDSHVFGDEVYLKRLFSNLLDNAIKFTESGGKVTARLILVSRDKAIVSVEDTGAGIDPKTLNKLGTRFFRADQARSKDGAGLGLSIVQAICAAHGANLRFESTLGQGTQVFIEMPLFQS